MKKILHIISSPRGEASYSIRLGRSIIEKISAAYPGSVVKRKYFGKQTVPPSGGSTDQLIFYAAGKQNFRKPPGASAF